MVKQYAPEDVIELSDKMSPFEMVTENKKEIVECFAKILRLSGFNAMSNPMKRTPERQWEVLRTMTEGYVIDPTLDRMYRDYALGDLPGVRICPGIHFVSMCVDRRSPIVTINGSKPAHEIQLGEQLVTIIDGKKTPTMVKSILPVDTGTKIRIHTDRKSEYHPLHPLMTQDGYKPAELIVPGDTLAEVNTRTLCRNTYEIHDTGYSLGYILGAIQSDGRLSDKIHQRVVRLQAKSKSFVEKYVFHFDKVFNKHLDIDPVHTYGEWHELDMYRAQCCDIDIIDKLQQMFDEAVPSIVKSSNDIMQGYLDGYVDGDGDHNKTYPSIYSADEDRMKEIGKLIGKQSHMMNEGEHTLYIGKHPLTKFVPEAHELSLEGFGFNPTEVKDVERIDTSRRPFRMISFECFPYPTYIANGVMQKNCEHHFAPFYGTVDIAYVPGNGKVTGLSKLPQLVQKYARRPQLQERMVSQIADELMNRCEAIGVMVIGSGYHTCEMIEGIHEGFHRDKPYITPEIRGLFVANEALKNEVLSHLGRLA